MNLRPLAWWALDGLILVDGPMNQGVIYLKWIQGAQVDGSKLLGLCLVCQHLAASSIRVIQDLGPEVHYPGGS